MSTLGSSYANDSSNVSENVQLENVSATALFREHALYVRALLRKWGVYDTDLDDAVQEVFIVVHQRGGYAPGVATAKSWLGAIALNIARNARRGAYRRNSRCVTQELDTHADIRVKPDAQLHMQDTLSRIARQLESVCAETREVFYRFIQEDETCIDIAAALGIPVGTVYSRVSKARKVLQNSRHDFSYQFA